jgi:2-methylisocitrate lyase-like PEP mutase family enzyme
MTADLRTMLAAGQVIAPGVYDALTASLAASCGFAALYLSGAAIAYTKLGAPDIGLVSMSEVADTVAAVRDRVDLPLIVDADTGFGNALNVQRTVRVFERAGASAIQLEDQGFPKRCGHLRGKTVIPMLEMVGKVRAAVDARASEATLIVARTDAAAVQGQSAAIERAQAYAQAGADVLFVEAPPSRAAMAQIGVALSGMRPLLANMVDGGDTPPLASEDLEALGFRLMLCARAYYASLAQHRSNLPFRERMLDFTQLNEALGTAEMLALGQKYEGQA